MIFKARYRGRKVFVLKNTSGDDKCCGLRTTLPYTHTHYLPKGSANEKILRVTTALGDLTDDGQESPGIRKTVAQRELNF